MQKARYGILADPSIVIEVEELEKKSSSSRLTSRQLAGSKFGRIYWHKFLYDLCRSAQKSLTN